MVVASPAESGLIFSTFRNRGIRMPAQKNGNAERPAERSNEDLSRELRIACWGGLLVAVIGYCVHIPMKMAGELPPEQTWIRVIFGPALMAGMMPAYLFAGMRYPNRCLFAMWMVTLSSGAVVFGLMFLEWALKP
jgi:hypothetical protein